jgi:phosphohistidine phosphatase SixA
MTTSGTDFARSGFRIRLLWLAIASLFFVPLSAAAPLAAQSGPAEDAAHVAAPTVVYLVRHAERAEDGTNDPPISVAGEARARLVAHMLADAGIRRVHSTDYRRTRATAAPLADVLDLAIETYDGADLNVLAARLRAEGGRHLVVGHSNTTPELVSALGGDPGTPIDDAEYDRLYILTLTSDAVSTVLIRFGPPAPS